MTRDNDNINWSYLCMKTLYYYYYNYFSDRNLVPSLQNNKMKNEGAVKSAKKVYNEILQYPPRLVLTKHFAKQIKTNWIWNPRLDYQLPFHSDRAFVFTRARLRLGHIRISHSNSILKKSSTANMYNMLNKNYSGAPPQVCFQYLIWKSWAIEKIILPYDKLWLKIELR